MKTSKALQERIKRAVAEHIEIVPYNPVWVKRFKQEAAHLKNKFPKIIRRIEHFGSTSVPGLAAKPIVDMLVEVSSLGETKKIIVPALEAEGYDYFWRPDIDRASMYAWFIKRNKKGQRTHHIHMVEKGSSLWDRLCFRDYLRAHPRSAQTYQNLKLRLSKKFSGDREAYTKAKTDFVARVTAKAKKYYQP